MVVRIVDTPRNGSTVIENDAPAVRSTRRAEATAKPPMIELIDIKKASEFLGVSVSTVRRMQKERVLSVYHVAGRVMFDLFDLHEYLERRRTYALR